MAGERAGVLTVMAYPYVGHHRRVRGSSLGKGGRVAHPLDLDICPSGRCRPAGDRAGAVDSGPVDPEGVGFIALVPIPMTGR